MDNKYNYDEYNYGAASESEETLNNASQEAKQEWEDVSQEVQQEWQDISQEEVEQPAESSNVNFIMCSPQADADNEAKEEQSDCTYSSTERKVDYIYNTDRKEPEQKADSVKPEAGHVPKQKEKKRKGGKRKWAACIGMAIVFGLVASIVFQASNRVINGIFGETETQAAKTVNTTQVSTNTDSKVNSDIVQVAANVMPSVVSITNLSVQEVQTFFFGGTTTQESESSGSGIIIGQNDSELLIVSNNHVVADSNTLTVTFVDGSSVEAQIKGTNADIDLAIIAVPLENIQSETLDEIKVAVLGDSDELAVGEPAIAIGNALGYGQSVTCGIISAVDREIDGYASELIQTDAAINPGNSGGALLNANGEVIGINTVKVSADAVEGMGYAIPISDVTDVINDLMNRETRTKVEEADRGTIGIQGVDIDESMSQIYDMPQGIYIKEVIKGGAAEKAGIPRKSIITEFDGVSVNDMDELTRQLEYYKAGEEVELTVEVPGENGEYVEKTYEITLGTQSQLNQ